MGKKKKAKQKKREEQESQGQVGQQQQPQMSILTPGVYEKVKEMLALSNSDRLRLWTYENQSPEEASTALVPYGYCFDEEKEVSVEWAWTLMRSPTSLAYSSM